MSGHRTVMKTFRSDTNNGIASFGPFRPDQLVKSLGFFLTNSTNPVTAGLIAIVGVYESSELLLNAAVATARQLVSFRFGMGSTEPRNVDLPVNWHANDAFRFLSIQVELSGGADEVVGVAFVDVLPRRDE